MTAQIRLAILAAAAALSFWAGWEWRDRSADVTIAERDTKDAQAQTQAVTQARTDDHATQQGATAVEEQRVEQDAKREATFQSIDREVFRYVSIPPAAAGPDVVDADFLRIWNAASAGKPARAEPVDSARTAGRLP